MTAKGRASNNRRKAGFTLLEVLLTAILAAAMLVGIWSLFRMYGGLYETGFVKTEKAQLVRSLMQQLSDDLANTVAASNEPILQGVPPAYSTSAASSDDAAAPATAGTAEDGFAIGVGSVSWASPPCPIHGSLSYGGRVGLMGTRNRLRLDILQTEPARPASPGASDPLEWSRDTFSGSRPAGIVTVVYSFQDPLSYDDPFASEPGLKRQVIRWGESESSRGGPAGKTMPTWHGRETAPQRPQSAPQRLDTEPGEQSSDTATALGWSTMYLPEVAALELRYYDGHGWSGNWDSRTRKSLPLAIEVAVQLCAPGKTTESPQDALEVPVETGVSAEGEVLPATGVNLFADNNELLAPEQQAYRFLIHLAQTERPKPQKVGVFLSRGTDAPSEAATTSSFGAAAHFSFGAPTTAHGPGCTCEFPLGSGP